MTCNKVKIRVFTEAGYNGPYCSKTVESDERSTAWDKAQAFEKAILKKGIVNVELGEHSEVVSMTRIPCGHIACITFHAIEEVK